MAINVGQDGQDDDELNAAINTTPLVDVMLVLLIIFLITIPVVLHDVRVDLPLERNQPRQTKPEDITISVDREGQVFWGQQRVDGTEQLLARLKTEAARKPQPEVHIRGDLAARYASIGRVLYACQRASIVKVGFVLQPPPRG